MFFQSLPKSKEEKKSLVLEIQSGLIRGVLFTNGSDNNPIVLQVIIRKIERKIHTNNQYIYKKMLKTLSEICSLISENNYIDNIDIVLSSPWSLSHSKKIKMTFTNDTEIEHKLLSGIVKEEKKKMSDEFEIKYKNLLSSKSHFKYIEHKIFDIKLNGYSVTDYIGKKVRSIEISFAMTLSLETILDDIKDIISKKINTKKIEFHSSLLLNFLSLRNLIPEKDDYIYIHIHNELTDIIVVKRGVCVNISSFPIGISSIVRKVSHTFNQNDSVSDSMISLYQGDKLSNIENRKIKNIFNEFERNWLLNYKKTVETLNNLNEIPRLIILFTHSHSDIFKNILNNSNEDKIHIIDFNLEELNSNVSFKNLSDKSQSIELYIHILNDML